MTKKAKPSKARPLGAMLAKALIDAAEATVMVPAPAPSDHGKVVVGFRVDRSKVGVANLIAAFNEMVDLAETRADVETAIAELEQIAREVPETVSLDDVQHHAWLRRLILVADDLANRVDSRALDWIKSQ